MIVHPRLAGLGTRDLEEVRGRTEEIARRPSTTHDGREEVLALESRGQSYVVPLPSILGVGDLAGLAPVPRAHPAVRGMIAFRGEVLVAFELAALARAESTGFTDLRRFLILSTPKGRLALLTERTLEVRPVDRNSFVASTLSAPPFVLGSDGQGVSWVDPDALITHAFGLLKGGRS